MRLPAYGKALLKLREAGKVPWVVVVALGHIIDTETLRGQAGVARIGLPFDYPFDSGDLALLRGLDLLVSCFRPETVSAADAQKLHYRAMDAILERGEPGLVWAVGAAAHSAAPVERAPTSTGRLDFYTATYAAVPLDQHFREALAWWRKCALLGGSGVFARPEFDPVRERVRRELAGGRVAH